MRAELDETKASVEGMLSELGVRERENVSLKDRVAALGDLGAVSSIAAAALREEDPVRTRSGKRTSVVAS